MRVQTSETVGRAPDFVDGVAAISRDEPAAIPFSDGLDAPIAVADGQVLFEQGDDPDAVDTLVSGAIGVSTRDPWDESTRRLARLGQPETLGEHVLQAGEPRAPTATALRDTHLLRLPTDGSEALITRHSASLLPFADQIDCPGRPVCLRQVRNVLLLAELGYRCAREALEAGRLRVWA